MALPLLVLLAGLATFLVRRASEGSVTTAGATLAWTPSVAVRVPRRWPAIRDLSRAEARSLFRHPLAYGGAAIALLTTGLGGTTDGVRAYFELTGAGASGLYLPTLLFLAAHLTATRARRAGTEEVFDTAATSNVDRTLASCLAGVRVAVAVLGGVLLAALYYRIAGADLPTWPGPFELLILPLSVLGAVTLGTMVGRWLPWRGVGPPFLVLLIAVTGLLVGDMGPRAPLFASYTELVSWEETGHVTIPLHLSAAHAMYLLGLDAMAVVGAVLRDSRTRVWWVLGFVAVAFTAAMGAWQVS
jgi:hypothetical protein